MKFALVLFASLIVLVFHAGVQAADIPEEIQKIVPIYPDAKIGPCNTTKNTTRVMFETAATPQEVFEFYKKEMTRQGWAILHENTKGSETRLVMKKGDRQFGFSSTKISGKGTVFFFSVTDTSAKE